MSYNEPYRIYRGRGGCQSNPQVLFDKLMEIANETAPNGT